MHKDIAYIEELKKQLFALGYYRYQIHNIMDGNVKSTRLSKLSSEQLNDVIETLTNHINFAQKCKAIFIYPVHINLHSNDGNETS
ncbi:MAG: hypothetical protein H6Q74_932 [Firmicutes bacterium]|nr:hypothetical protein [Bacillota bacterium]